MTAHPEASLHRTATSRYGRVLSLAALLTRPSRQGAAAAALTVVAFAVTTALLLVVVGGTRMFFAHPVGPSGLSYGGPSVFALVLLSVPLLNLGASAARLSSRRRDRQLATLRLLGASGTEITLLTVIESTLAAFAGAIGGIVLYGALLPVVGRLPFFGGPIGPTAAWAGWTLVAVVIAVVTVLAIISSLVGLRRVQVTPLGVRRRTYPPPKRTLLLIAAIAALVVIAAAVASLDSLGNVLAPAAVIAVLFGLFAAAMGVLNLIGTPLVAARGRALARRAKTASELIAGRELAALAATAWRRVSAVSMTCFIAVLGGIGFSAFGQADNTDPIGVDLRTGLLVTLGISFALLACSVGVTQAASILEDRDLIVGLDRLGIPACDLHRARRISLMLPLRWAALGGTLTGVALILPLAGLVLIVAPATVATITATLSLGFLLVRLALTATRPIVASIRRAASRGTV